MSIAAGAASFTGRSAGPLMMTAAAVGGQRCRAAVQRGCWRHCTGNRRGLAAAAGRSGADHGSAGAAPSHKELHEQVMARLTTPRDDAGNPLLHEMWEPWARQVQYIGRKTYVEFHLGGQTMYQRGMAISRYSYAVPSAEALAAIAEASAGRVVEVGSGSGYWSKLLKARGVDVIAVDIMDKEYCPRGPVWFPETVEGDGAQYLREHSGCPDRALLMSWGGFHFCEEALSEFKGRTLVCIGEVEGCTWFLDQEKHPEWKLTKTVDIPTWTIGHDAMRIYTREGP